MTNEEVEYVFNRTRFRAQLVEGDLMRAWRRASELYEAERTGDEYAVAKAERDRLLAKLRHRRERALRWQRELWKRTGMPSTSMHF